MRGHALRVPADAALLGALLLVNVLVASRVAADSAGAALLVAVLPAVLIALGALIASDRSVLVFGGLALAVLGGRVNTTLPVGGVQVYPSDVVVLLALGAWVAAWLAATPAERPRWPRTPLFGWPFLLFAIFVLAGVVRGHEQYDASLLSGPMVRLVLYAGIAAAIGGLTARKAYKGLVVVLYAGAIYHAVLGTYHLASGIGSTGGGELSTGGVRYVALSTTIYLTAALVLALVNLEFDKTAGRRTLHFGIAALASFGIVLAFGRITWLVAGLVCLALVLGSRGARGAFVSYLPLFVPALILLAILLPHFAPGLRSDVERRIQGTSSQDTSLLYREEADEAIFEQIRESPVTGVGYGRPITFTVDGQRITQGQDPHNGFLYLWAVGGLLALGSFGVLMLVYLGDATARLRRAIDAERAVLLCALAAWVVLLANVYTQPWLGSPSQTLTFWILLLMPAVVAQKGEHTRGGDS